MKPCLLLLSVACLALGQTGGQTGQTGGQTGQTGGQLGGQTGGQTGQTGAGQTGGQTGAGQTGGQIGGQTGGTFQTGGQIGGQTGQTGGQIGGTFQTGGQIGGQTGGQTGVQSGGQTGGQVQTSGGIQSGGLTGGQTLPARDAGPTQTGQTGTPKLPGLGGDGSYGVQGLRCNGFICTSWNGTKSCATSSGCTCDPLYELSCTAPGGFTVCKDLRYFSKCPLSCGEKQQPCPRVNFTNGNTRVIDTVCASKGDCPVLCGLGAVFCQGQGDNAFCAPSTVGCPLVCQRGNKTCSVVNYAASSNTVVSQSTVCAPAAKPCPCGANAQQCPGNPGQGLGNENGATCIAASDSCPVQCTGKRCPNTGFTADGRIDTTSPSQVSCANAGAACRCGANAVSCSWTDDDGRARSECRFGGDGCPLADCPKGLRRCIVVNYNSSGFVVNTTQQCAPYGQCPCGTYAQACKGEDKGNRCTPLVDFKTSQPVSCPVWCDGDSQSKCTLPSFDQNGKLINSTTICVAKGTACDCSLGVNATTCNITNGKGRSSSQCIPLVGGYCPLCSSGQIPCPQVDNFLADGTYLSTTAPSNSSTQPICAGNSSQCGCGDNARACSVGKRLRCVPTAFDCPPNCADGQKLCRVSNYDSSGNLLNTVQQCANSGDGCVCGSNAGKCPGRDECLPSGVLAQLCPCKSTESVCFVDNYDQNGVKTGATPVCVDAGTVCPCGTNTISCTNPRQVSKTFCLPKTTPLGPSVCPAPCTAAQEQAGSKTCVQTNLDANGGFVSRNVTCVPPGSSCQPGTNQVQCPSGALIWVGAQCSDPYGYADPSYTPPVPTGSDDTSTVTFAVSNLLSSDISPKLAANLKTSLQCPSNVDIDVQVVGKTVIVTVRSTTGEGKQVAQSLIQMITSGQASAFGSAQGTPIASGSRRLQTQPAIQVNMGQGVSSSTTTEVSTTSAETETTTVATASGSSTTSGRINSGQRRFASAAALTAVFLAIFSTL